MLKATWRLSQRTVLAGLLLAGLLFATLVLGLRYWVLPNIQNYRTDIAQAVSQATGVKIAIGRIAGNWEGLRPHLVLAGFEVFDPQGRLAIKFDQVESTLSWWTLFSGELTFQSIELERPSFIVRRDSAGVISVAGIPLNQGGEQSGFGDWLLNQRRLVMRDAVIVWHDALTGLSPFALTQVHLRLENYFGRHNFALRAVPPEQLAGPLDIRGEGRGQSLAKLEEWSGRLYAELPYADIAALEQYVKPPGGLPVALRQGTGGIRLWLSFASARVSDLVLDVSLRHAAVRLAPDLKELALETLGGRLGYRDLKPGFQLSGKKLGFTTAPGVALAPADILFQWAPATGKRLAHGEIQVSRFDLAALTVLSEHLPLPADARQRIAVLQPSGTVQDWAMKWSGDPAAPASYSIKGHIAGASLQTQERVPGFTGLNAIINGSQAGGTVSITSGASSLTLPKLFPAPLEFQTFTGQASWKQLETGTQFTLNNLAFANADLAGTVYGVYITQPHGPGAIDLVGRLSRGDAREGWKYVPLVLSKETRDWLVHSVLSARSNEVVVKLKGDLADFPFVDEKRGLFEVTAKITDGVLDYAAGWPRIENITTDLLFRGKRMEINASQASIFDAKLHKVSAVIPDLIHHEVLLTINGEAVGAVADKIRYVNQSPVGEMIGGLTKNIKAGGSGKLILKLDLPLHHRQDTKVAGDYQFINAAIMPGPGYPGMTAINGHLRFTEAGIQARAISAQILGGPATVNLTSKAGGVNIDAQGRVNAAALPAAFGNNPLLRNLSGSADWRGELTLNKAGGSEFRLSSPLKEIASVLPDPFAKLAGQVLPMQYQSSVSAAREEQILFSLGNVVFGKLQMEPTAVGASSVRRGVISFGKPAPPQARDGVWIIGSLQQLNFDRWRTLLSQSPQGAGLDLNGIELSLTRVTALGRDFSDLKMNLRQQAGTWAGSMTAKEFAGDVWWRPAGRGSLNARLTSLVIPDERADTAKAASPVDATSELPALDIVAENFQIMQKKLGRMELKAVQQARDWRIEKLKLATAGATLDAEGVWRAGPGRSQTNLTVQMNAPDAGKLLTQLGYPQSLKRGQVAINGTLSWPGSPPELNPTRMSGDIKLEAKAGQFLKIEPGVGKLLGLVSLQALPRRITLDFRDVFSDGFAFDDIVGNLNIHDGLMHTDDFVLRGPAAVVTMTGDVDLGPETQNLHVRVIPTVGEGVSIASALFGGPVVGLTTLLIQKILRDPLGKIIAYEYNVTGTWDNPTVTKVARTPPPQPSEQAP